MASYVAAYRVGMLVSSAGALFLVSGFEVAWLRTPRGLERELSGDGGAGGRSASSPTLVATRAGEVGRGRATRASGGTARCAGFGTTVVGAFQDFFSREGVLVAIVVLVFVVLFKFTDALAGVMTGPFAVDLGFTRNEYATIIKGVGFAATLIGGFAGGYVARALSARRRACGSAASCRRSPISRSPGRRLSATISRG